MIPDRYVLYAYTILLAASSFLFRGADIAGSSPRTFLIVGGALVAILYVRKGHICNQRSKHLLPFTLIHIVFAVYLTILYIFKQSDAQYALLKILSTQGLGLILCLLLATGFVVRKTYLDASLAFLSISFLFAILQFAGINFAWTLADVLNPRFIEFRASMVQGLSLNSISLGNELILFCGIFLYLESITSLASFSFKIFVVSRVLVHVLIILTAFVVQSRSVCLSVLIIGIIFSIYSSTSNKRVKIAGLSIFLAGFISFCLVSSSQVNAIVASTSQNKLGVLLVNKSVFLANNLTDNFQSSNIPYSCAAPRKSDSPENLTSNKYVLGGESFCLRIHASRAVIQSIRSYADVIFGPSFAYYSKIASRDYPGVSHFPHNIVFNSMLVGGLSCLILVALITYYHLAIFRRDAIYGGSMSLLTTYIALLFNSFFHNDSLLYGSVFVYTLLGLSNCLRCRSK